MFKKLSLIISIVIVFLFAFNLARAEGLAYGLAGKILLQVEKHGEAWYVNPNDSHRYYLGRPADAFNIMRTLGLGISNKDFDAFKGVAPVRLAGKIVLKVEAHGEAYYVNPAGLKLYYLGRPADAFAVMRELGLGITDENLAKINVASGYDVPVAQPNEPGGKTGEEPAPTVCATAACAEGKWRVYTLTDNECVYADDDCSDCSCACGGFNTEETGDNGNCADGLDNDCDGTADAADAGCIFSGTAISGAIAGSVAWTEAAGPYLVSGVLTVEKGATLTINPGVTVKFGSSGEIKGKLLNKGDIMAPGSADQHIIFTSASASPQKGDWDGITVVDGGYLNFSNAEIKYATVGVNAPNASNIVVTDSLLSDGGAGLLTSGPATISGNTFEGNDAGLIYSGTTVSNDDDGTFILFTERLAEIQNNIIRDNTGASDNPNHGGLILRDVAQNGYVLRLKYNLISGNSVGIRFTDSTFFTRLTMEKNDIFGNTAYNVWCGNEASKITLVHNWWGTSNYDEIDAKIYDYYDVSTQLPIVDYKPAESGPAAGN